jgi:hypothetical protein
VGRGGEEEEGEEDGQAEGGHSEVVPKTEHSYEWKISLSPAAPSFEK